MIVCVGDLRFVWWRMMSGAILAIEFILILVIILGFVSTHIPFVSLLGNILSSMIIYPHSTYSIHPHLCQTHPQGHFALLSISSCSYPPSFHSSFRLVCSSRRLGTSLACSSPTIVIEAFCSSSLSSCSCCKWTATINTQTTPQTRSSGSGSITLTKPTRRWPV